MQDPAKPHGNVLPTRLAGCVAALALLLASIPGGATRADDALDLTRQDLSGAWYVLIHFKDSRSEDKSITKFKDFAWLIQQNERELSIEECPYVIFDEGSEELRRFAMRAHKPWEPEGPVLSALRENVDVSSRAMRKKTLKGNAEKGFKSLEPLSAGTMTMNFTRNWDIDFKKERIRIQVIDSLSAGSDMLDDMEEAIVYEITGRTPEGDLVGTYAEGEKSGTLRLMRSKERRIIK